MSDIIQRILIEGGGEAGAQFAELGETGVEAFQKIAEAAETAGAGLTIFSGGTLAIIAAIAAVVIAIAEFEKVQAEAVVSTAALGEAFGTTAAGVQGLREAFEEFGVTAEATSRAMARTVQEIDQAWSGIQASIRNAGTAHEASAERIAAADQRISNAASESAAKSEDWAQTMKKDALSVAEAWENLKNSASDMASSATHDLQSIAGASLSVEEAELKLKEFQTGHKDQAAEHALQGRRLEQGVKDARQHQSDASDAALKHMEDDPLKQAKARQAYDDAQKKISDDNRKQAQEQADQSLKDREQATSAKKAREADYNASLKDLDNIRAAIEGGGVGGGINLKDVSLGDLKRATIYGAGKDQAGGEKPTGADVWKEATENVRKFGMSANEAAKIMGFGGRAGTMDAAGAAKALKQTDIGGTIADADKDSSKLQPSNVANAENIVGASARVSGKFSEIAAKVATANTGLGGFTQALTSATTALKNSGGGSGGDLTEAPLGHAKGGMIKARVSNGEFVMGAGAVKRFGSGFMHAVNGGLVPHFAEGGDVGDDGNDPVKEAQKASDDHYASMPRGLHGAAAEKFDQEQRVLIAKVNSARKKAAQAEMKADIQRAEVWNNNMGHPSMSINDPTRDMNDPTRMVPSNYQGPAPGPGPYSSPYKTSDASSDTSTAPQQVADSGRFDVAEMPIMGVKGADDARMSSGPEGQPPPSLPWAESAEGGEIHGAGTGTSDSIHAMLSHGEFVMKAASVQNYGTDFMHAINNMGYAMGGPVVSPIHMAAGGSAGGGGSGGRGGGTPIHLHLDGQEFVTHAADHVAASLKTHAISQQTTSTGRKPSWMR